MTDKDAERRTDELIRVIEGVLTAARMIESVSTAARWRTPQAITVDFVTRCVAKGDRILAVVALEALEFAGVLVFEEIDSRHVYRLADEYKKNK